AKLAAALCLAARRASGGRAWTLVLVAEDQPALLEVVRRHLDGHAVAGQGLDAVLLHLARGVGDDLVTCIELYAVARIGQNFGDQSFELDQLFFSHGSLQIGRRLVGFSVAFVVRSAFAVQKRHALQSVRLAAAMVSRAMRLLTVDLRSAIITTTTAAA